MLGLKLNHVSKEAIGMYCINVTYEITAYQVGIHKLYTTCEMSRLHVINLQEDRHTVTKLGLDGTHICINETSHHVLS